LPGLALNLARLLVRKGRTALAPAIASQFKQMVETQQGIERATATTAVPLTDSERQNLSQRLESQTGHRIVLETAVDPALLGGDGIARVHGLSECMYSELVEFENGAMGLALNLEEETVGVLVLGDYLKVEEGQQVKTTGRIAEVPVGEALLGRVVDALGNPLD